jgi:ABC-2 type transport system permease protein
MPIYEQSYRRYEARAPLRAVRYWPITREALRLLVRKRVFWFLIAGAWLPLVVLAVTLYLGVVRALGTRLFSEFMNTQLFMSVILTIFAGGGLIASDLRTGAILIYLSRPLTRRDYVLGKLGVLLIVNLAITLVPGLLLWVAAVGLAPASFARWDLWWLPLAVAVQAFTISLAVSVGGLCLSSLARSVRTAGLGFFIVAFGLDIIYGLLWGVFRTRGAGLISLQENLRILGRAFFGGTRVGEPPWFLAFLVLAAMTVAGLAVVGRRVRAVEIVR